MPDSLASTLRRLLPPWLCWYACAVIPLSNCRSECRQWGWRRGREHWWCEDCLVLCAGKGWARLNGFVLYCVVLDGWMDVWGPYMLCAVTECVPYQCKCIYLPVLHSPCLSADYCHYLILLRPLFACHALLGRRGRFALGSPCSAAVCTSQLVILQPKWTYDPLMSCSVSLSSGKPEAEVE